MALRLKPLHLFTLVMLTLLVFSIGNSYSFTGMVVAPVNSIDDALKHPEAVKDQYNANFEKVPNIVKTIFGNEVINLTITRTNGTISSLSLVTQKGKMAMVSVTPLQKYTLDVQVSEATINAIANDKDPTGRLKQALQDNEIKYQARRITTSFKTGFARLMLWMFG